LGFVLAEKGVGGEGRHATLGNSVSHLGSTMYTKNRGEIQGPQKKEDWGTMWDEGGTRRNKLIIKKRISWNKGGQPGQKRRKKKLGGVFRGYNGSGRRETESSLEITSTSRTVGGTINST